MHELLKYCQLNYSRLIKKFNVNVTRIEFDDNRCRDESYFHNFRK